MNGEKNYGIYGAWNPRNPRGNLRNWTSWDSAKNIIAAWEGCEMMLKMNFIRKNTIDLLWILMARQVRIADLYEWWRICMDFFIESSTNNDGKCGSNDIICQPICQPTPENHEDHLGPKSPIFMFVGYLLQRFILQRWCQVQAGNWNSKAPVSWAKLG